jgi:hypothetical protein
MTDHAMQSHFESNLTSFLKEQNEPRPPVEASCVSGFFF